MFMRINISSKGSFKNIQKWAAKTINGAPVEALQTMGDEGVKQLSSNTPRDTGVTAEGWDYEIATRSNLSEISWFNKAHPGLSVNMARIIDQGHGTGSGGYVPPNPYIRDSMSAAWKSTLDKSVKEMVK